MVVKIPSWPVLKPGISGQNVRALQELLNYYKYPVTVTGRLDPATQQTVTRFQKSHNIVPDSSTPESSYGIVGERTLSALVVTLRGSGPSLVVRAVQHLLSKFERVTINGDLSTSFDSIFSFQKKMGLETNTVIDYTLWQYLFGYSSYPLTASLCYPSKLNNAQMYVNAKYILKYLTSRGFSKNAACGILGNMYAETAKIDPGLWEDGYFDCPRGGYGLVQWTTYKYEENKMPNPFMIHATDIGLISHSEACSELDSLALSNPKKLMNAELDWLIESMGSRDYFYYDDAYNNLEDKKAESAITFETFKTSDMSASDLAIVFHDFYERSNDTYKVIMANRATPAQNYFDTGLFE